MFNQLTPPLPGPSSTFSPLATSAMFEEAVEVAGNEAFLIHLLERQQSLSAVEAFSIEMESGVRSSQASHYTKLMPTTVPSVGQQYAFEVDLDRCSGCKACVAACHSLNGLDPVESWRDVGLLIGGTTSLPVMQHVTSACHHCIEPACMHACPVNAYEKDLITGIVRHLDDQCFGCQYCTLACPYGVPKYHAQKGIVRKCDMCSHRLADGEAPACVQACPHEAISIRIVDRQQVIEDAEADPFLPAAPDPQITLPTTRYKTTRVFPRNMLPVDYYQVNPQHPHWPLIIMLVLTQMSIGAFIVNLLFDPFIDQSLLSAFRKLHATIALFFGLFALGASTLHLGRPQYAFRAVLGLRHSWLSREIVAFGLFANAAVCFAVACWLLPNSYIVVVLAWTVAITGMIGVFCSTMIYVFTKREFWSFGRTIAKFSLTSAILGIAATWLTIIVYGLFIDESGAELVLRTAGRTLILSLTLTTALKMALELWFLTALLSRQNTPLKRTARLLVG
ncbi:MAG TPA: DmsC/YnfH family molybdoenzyme membrane anchor subunit, partial [Pirellula sp.]|nr:DmsC/YnfH family molybdoenzyme membrane anchor subunit [Pirellula sp.]